MAKLIAKVLMVIFFLTKFGETISKRKLSVRRMSVCTHWYCSQWNCNCITVIIFFIIITRPRPMWILLVLLYISVTCDYCWPGSSLLSIKSKLVGVGESHMRHQQRLLCTSSGKRHQYYYSSYTATVLQQYCHVEVELRGPSKTPAEASVQGNGTSTLCTVFQYISNTEYCVHQYTSILNGIVLSPPTVLLLVTVREVIKKNS